MGEKGVSVSDPDFLKRRETARSKINAMDRDAVHDQPERQDFFNAVYDNANGDPAFVPWADLKPKEQLIQWLAKNNGIKSSSALTALDVACGLGDNAEALAAAGYQTTAFDLSGEAINWARKRFPESLVNYRAADLFDLPGEWKGAFDLVHECYTLQSMPPEMLGEVAGAITTLVKPGGTLLIYARIRNDGAPADGPPWPLEEKSAMMFDAMGFDLVTDTRFDLNKNTRHIPHAFSQWKKRESGQDRKGV